MERAAPCGLGGSIALAALVVLIAVVARYHGYLSVDRAIVDHDWYTLHRVDATHLELAVRQGTAFPFWSPWILGGTPLFAVPTKPFSYPPFWLGVLALGPSFAMNALLVAHVFLGGIGAALLARRLGLAGIAPSVCGASFVLARFPANGFEATPFGFGYAIAWWPWTTIAWIDLLERRRPDRAAILLASLLALQWHAGGEFALSWLASFLAALAVPWLARRWSARELASFARLAVVVAAAFLGLIAIKLLPELAWLASSGRADPLGLEFARDSALEEQHARLGHASRLATFGHLLVDNYRGGGRWTLALGIACGAAIFVRRLARPIAGTPIRAWIGLALGSVLCFALASGTLHELAYELMPGYDRMRRHTRFVHAFGFGAILLAGFGLQLSWSGLASPRGRLARVALTVALAAAVAVDVRELVASELPPLRSASARESVLRELYRPVLDDPRISRIHHEENREQPSWIALRIESTSGALGGPRSASPLYTALLPERTLAQGLELELRGALDVLNVHYVASYHELALAHLEPVARPDDLPDEGARRCADLGARPFFLYRRATARARAATVLAPTFVVGEASATRAWIRGALGDPTYDSGASVLVEFDAARLDELAASGGDAPRSVVFADRAPDDAVSIEWTRAVPGGSWSSHPRGGAWWRREHDARRERVQPLEDSRFSRTADSIEVDVRGREGFLVLAETATLHPGWRASIDGAPARMERADGLATLIRLPPDARRVELHYLAPGFALGAWVSAATLLVLAAAAWLRRRTTANVATQPAE